MTFAAAAKRGQKAQDLPFFFWPSQMETDVPPLTSRHHFFARMTIPKVPESA